MNEPLSLHLESKLQATTEAVWEWITSVACISAEMWPYFRMTAPKGMRSLNNLEIEPGVRMFRSIVFLLGFLPIDYSNMTLVELEPGQGFVEQSPMGSMKLWRHERRIHPDPEHPKGVLLVDQLIFKPRFAPRFVGWFIKRVFIHRHEVLKTQLGGI